MRKKLQGKVVSDKMDKTIVIEVKRSVRHPIYKKKYTVTKKYQTHDEKNEFKINDIVEIEQSRPYSKLKKWKVVKKINLEKK